jgi:plasmid stabilization system protein ParE
MKYTVLWTHDAEEDLGDIWIDAYDRNAITQATHRMDQALRNDPHLQRESREGNVRIVFESPLAAHIEVAQEDRKVFVITVWTTRRS